MAGQKGGLRGICGWLLNTTALTLQTIGLNQTKKQAIRSCKSMSDDTDFVALYDELGLDAECSMASFKHAYRRRIAKLHPDHFGAPPDISRLQRLNRLYSAALEFHRIHGRLPGASRPIGALGAAPIRNAHQGDGNSHSARNQHDARVATIASPMLHSTGTATAYPMAGFPRRRRYLLMLGLLALLLYWL